MIKILREANHRHPWILQTTMAIIAITFVVGMGWWGLGQQQSDAVASVGELKVSLDEYRRSYQNIYRYYRDQLKGEVKEDVLKQMVMERLISGKLWTIAAQELGVDVTPEELRDDIMRREEFQRNGKFDPEVYKRLLASVRMTPSMYESEHRMDLLRGKAMTVVRDSVALTPVEISEAQSLIARQSPGDVKDGASAGDRILHDFLQQKQERALAAYEQSLKTRLNVKVHKELL